MSHCPMKYNGSLNISNLFLLNLLMIKIQSEVANNIMPIKNNSINGLKLKNASSQDCQIKHVKMRLYKTTGNFNGWESIGFTVRIKYIHTHIIGINI